MHTFLAVLTLTSTSSALALAVGLCGGILDTPCSDGFFCEKPPLTCGQRLRLGMCQPQPEVCTLQYEPVCGCDGETYSNDCERMAAGVALANEGPCTADESLQSDDDDKDDDAPEVESCGGLFGSSCSEGFFCEKPPLTCGQRLRAGVCESKPQICAFQYEPVCGCDGVTYSNDCKRKSAGVALADQGACGPGRASPLPDGMIFDGVEKSDGDAHTGGHVESGGKEKSDGDVLEEGEGEEGDDPHDEEGEGEAGDAREAITNSPPVSASSPSPSTPSPSPSP